MYDWIYAAEGTFSMEIMANTVFSCCLWYQLLILWVFKILKHGSCNDKYLYFYK